MNGKKRNNETGNYDEIKLGEAADPSEYTITSVTESAKYLCVVSDSYSGNYENLYYYVYVDNNFSAYAWIDEDGYKYNDKTELVAPKESVTLKAFVSAHDPSGAKYGWKQRNNETGNYDEIKLGEAADPSKYTITTVTEPAEYLCVVTDSYSGSSGGKIYIIM